ncbi:MAG: DNA gyrase inhibitor YacG [Desulfuromonadales bacterium]|nr:DNA gyrase inhibitor YacG [Desulfuromonadales bacterium]
MDILEVKCPRCGKKSIWSDNPSRPFCSEKCRIIDLGSWASEEYSVDGGRAPQPDDYY